MIVTDTASERAPKRCKTDAGSCMSKVSAHTTIGVQDVKFTIPELLNGVGEKRSVNGVLFCSIEYPFSI